MTGWGKRERFRDGKRAGWEGLVMGLDGIEV